jgi:hypothetical protein
VSEGGGGLGAREGERLGAREGEGGYLEDDSRTGLKDEARAVMRVLEDKIKARGTRPSLPPFPPSLPLVHRRPRVEVQRGPAHATQIGREQARLVDGRVV